MRVVMSDAVAGKKPAGRICDEQLDSRGQIIGSCATALGAGMNAVGRREQRGYPARIGACLRDNSDHPSSR